ncbi:MAG TPA: response regulator [Ktedonobacterales bacterium]
MKLDDARSSGVEGQRTTTRALTSDAASVLVVDDDDSIRETLRFALEEEGYDVLDAYDGQSALAVLRGSEHGLVVLLDHIMPGVDGATLLRQLSTERELADRHSYVLITASAHASTLEAELNTLPLPSVSVVRKPFDLDTMFTAVREANLRLARE